MWGRHASGFVNLFWIRRDFVDHPFGIKRKIGGASSDNPVFLNASIFANHQRRVTVRFPAVDGIQDPLPVIGELKR